MKTIQFDSSARFTERYRTRNDVWKLTDQEITTLLDNYIGQKAEFAYRDYYGNTEEVKVWVESYKKEEAYIVISKGVKTMIYNYTVMINYSPLIPDRFVPGLLEIGKQLGLAAPISYTVL